MATTDTPARRPLSGDALEAARRAAKGTPPRREPIPMGIRYRNTTADARPSEPATTRPAWAQGLAATPTELLEDMDPRPAKPRARRAAGPVPAQQTPTTASPVNGAPRSVLSSPVDLDNTTTEPTPAAEPVGVPAPVSEPARPSEASTAMPSTSTAPADQPEPAEATPVEPETPVEQVPDGPETIEQILARAEACPSDAVQAAAQALREQAQRLGEALRIDAQAGGLREQIAALDAEIADRTARRDALRAELEKLLAGGVTVSADSGPRRAPKAAEVRAWARDNGYAISEKGLIPGGIMAAYQRAQDGSR
jgi:hypothetical protein